MGVREFGKISVIEMTLYPKICKIVAKQCMHIIITFRNHWLLEVYWRYSNTFWTENNSYTYVNIYKEGVKKYLLYNTHFHPISSLYNKDVTYVCESAGIYILHLKNIQFFVVKLFFFSGFIFLLVETDLRLQSFANELEAISAGAAAPRRTERFTPTSVDYRVPHKNCLLINQQQSAYRQFLCPLWTD